MINDQEYLTTELTKTLEKMIILSHTRMKNLVAIVVGLVVSQSVVLSKISQELKDSYSQGTEESKIKRLQRFLSNKLINPEKLYEYFAYKLIAEYKNNSNKIYIIFDHTTIADKFVILQFSLKVAQRAIPLWYKVFPYNENGNKDFIHIKEGLNFLHKIISPYNYNVTVLADRGFKSVDLFRFIDEDLCWKYCIRCTKDLSISIDNKASIDKLEDIPLLKNRTRYLWDVKLTLKNYCCNMAVCRAEGKDDVWYIANNLSQPFAIREYKKRFDIEEMFKDFKSGGFNLEDTWSMNLQYIKMMYFCLSIAYCWIIAISTGCMKHGKNNIIGATKNLNGKKVRIYSLFRAGIKWFKRSYCSLRSKYYIKMSFIIYES